MFRLTYSCIQNYEFCQCRKPCFEPSGCFFADLKFVALKMYFYRTIDYGNMSFENFIWWPLLKFIRGGRKVECLCVFSFYIFVTYVGIDRLRMDVLYQDKPELELTVLPLGT